MKNILVYTVHKAGSSFLDVLLRQTCRRYGIQHFSENDDQYFDAIAKDSWGHFIDQQDVAGCFGPIRGSSKEPILPESLSDSRIVLHLRDPRDVLTSTFFSFAFSHRIRPGRFEPSEQQRQRWREDGIDQFVRQKAPSLNRTYEKLIDRFVGLPNVTIVHYEKMVLEYSSWLKQFLSAFQHLNVPATKFRHRLLPQSLKQHKVFQQLHAKHRHAFRVDNEDVYQHKRRVIPGDHAEKLKPATIEYLNQEYKSYFALFGSENPMANSRRIA